MSRNPAASQSQVAAECYVALHRGVPGDIDFYRAGCQGAESVLELGVGNGRVLLQLEADELWGLERDPEMLHLAPVPPRKPSRSRVHLLQGDMAAFDLGRRFQRVIIPYNGLLCMAHDEQLACLKAVRQHLVPGGFLLFDLYLGDALHAEAEHVHREPDEDESEFLVQMHIDGTEYRVFEKNRWWPSLQRLDVVYEFYPLLQPSATDPLRAANQSLGSSRQEALFSHAARMTDMRIAHFYLLGSQVEPLLRRAGFEHVKWGQLEASEQWTIVAS